MTNPLETNGGPAFPAPDMSEQHFGHRSAYTGLSTLDYFAGQELAKVDGTSICDEPAAYERVADHCYRMARAMLDESDQPVQVRADLESCIRGERNRGDRFEKLLRAVCAAADKGDVGQTAELAEALREAKHELDDDEIPF